MTLPARNPSTPLWRGAIVLRVITFAYATGAVAAYHDEYERQWLAWTVYGVMGVWTVLTSAAYARDRTRWKWLVVVDLLLTTGLMQLTPLTHTERMYEVDAPLITTVWVTGALAACAIRFGILGGVISGSVLSAGTAIAAQRVNVDVMSDIVLLMAAGSLIGFATTTLRRAVLVRERALRIEAATAERERLARSIHDGVLQVLAQVRKRGTEVGGDAADLARLAGEQEIALRSLVASAPNGRPTTGDGPEDTADLRGRLQVLATPKIAVSTPAGEVRLPLPVVEELVAAVQEALSNVERHAGEGARVWVLLEDLGDQVTISVRDDGRGIEQGRLERAAGEGRLGVAQSIRGRVRSLGGTIDLDTTPGTGTEWEIRIPRAAAGRGRRARKERNS